MQLARVTRRLSDPILGEAARAGTTGRAVRATALAAVLALTILSLSQMLHVGWWLQDANGYWEAAMRLRAGAPLYPAVPNVDASDVYKYAPWFAYAWVPLTLLPKSAAMVLWIAAELAAVLACALPAIRAGTLAGVATSFIAIALLLPAAATGNVQPLVVAALLYGVERTTGPLWIAATASLKAMPLVLVAVYVGRRQWRRAAITMALTAALVAPMLLFDLSHYPLSAGAATGPMSQVAMYAAAMVAAGISMLLARGPYGWLAASVATVLAAPRWSYYVPSFLLVGLARPVSRRRDDPGA